MNAKIWKVKMPQLEALADRLDGKLSDPHAQYFDPQIYREWFEEFRAVTSELKDLEPELFQPLQLRELPQPCETSDFDGRGYFTRTHLQTLSHDIHLALKIIGHNAPRPSESAQSFFTAGQPFDAWKLLKGTLLQATSEVLIQDPYVDSYVLTMLEPLAGKVQIRILTRTMMGDFEIAAKKFAKQHGHLAIRLTHAFHDRFLVVDGVYYMLGASIKDAGTKGCMFVKVEQPRVLGSLDEALEDAWSKGDVVI